MSKLADEARLLAAEKVAKAAATNGKHEAPAKEAKEAPKPAAKPAAKPKPAPRPLPEWKPMPLDALPEACRMLAEEGASALGCDPAYIAMPALAVLAAAIGNSRTLRLKRTWRVPSVLWTVLVGDSGTLKSPAYRMAMAPLYAWQRHERQVHKAAVGIYEKEMSEWKAKAKGERSEEPEKPDPAGRAFASDITVEKLAVLLEDNPRGLLVARDELAGWFGSFMKYKAQGAGSDVPNWLEMYDAANITVDRKTGDRQSIFVERAAVCVTGGIQPGTLARALREEFYESGLVARLLLALPPRRRKRWTEAELEDNVEQAWDGAVCRLLSQQMARCADGVEPRVIDLAPDAKAAWVEFYDGWAGEQDAAEGEVAACYSKIEGVTPRLALLHHCAEAALRQRDSTSLVSLQSMEAAVTLAKWFASEAQRVYALARAGDEERRTVSLVAWLRRQGGSCTARDLHKANTSRYRASDEAVEALEALAAAGLGEWHDVVPGSQGGRFTQRFALKPAPPHEAASGCSPETPKPPETSGDPEEGDTPKPWDGSGTPF